MFRKDCKESTEVTVSENPETDSDEEESYKFKEDQLPYDTIYYMVQEDTFVTLYSFCNCSELFYVCKVLKCGIAEDKMLDNSGHSIKKWQKYQECYYSEKFKEVRGKVQYKLVKDVVFVLPRHMLYPCLGISHDLIVSLS